jgi:hypothetical protein
MQRRIKAESFKEFKECKAQFAKVVVVVMGW